MQAVFSTNMAEQIEVIILDKDGNPNNRDNFVDETARPIDKEGLAKAMKLSRGEGG